MKRYLLLLATVAAVLPAPGALADEHEPYTPHLPFVRAHLDCPYQVAPQLAQVQGLPTCVLVEDAPTVALRDGGGSYTRQRTYVEGTYTGNLDRINVLAHRLPSSDGVLHFGLRIDGVNYTVTPPATGTPWFKPGNGLTEWTLVTITGIDLLTREDNRTHTVQLNLGGMALSNVLVADAADASTEIHFSPTSTGTAVFVARR